MRLASLGLSVLALIAVQATPAVAAPLRHTAYSSATVEVDATQGCLHVRAPLGAGVETAGRSEAANPFVESFIQVYDVCRLDAVGNPTLLVEDAPDADPLPVISPSLTRATWSASRPSYRLAPSTYNPETGGYETTSTPMPYSFSITWTSAGPLQTEQERDATLNVTRSHRAATAVVTVAVDGKTFNTTTTSASLDRMALTWLP